MWDFMDPGAPALGARSLTGLYCLPSVGEERLKTVFRLRGGRVWGHSIWKVFGVSLPDVSLGEQGAVNLFLKIFILLFIYLAAPGLSCSMWDLQFRHDNSSMWHLGSSFLPRDRTQVSCIGSLEP